MGGDMIICYIDFDDAADLNEVFKIMLEKASTYGEDAAKYQLVINDFKDTLLNSREVESFSRLGRRFFVTGGMSWGGNPTGAADIFDAFWDLPEEIWPTEEA